MGAPNDIIANLTSFTPLLWTTRGTPLGLVYNSYDAATAQLKNPIDVNSAILSIGPVVAPPIPASLHQSVRKHGRTTLHTVGVVTDISASVRVGYGTNVADFDDQIAIIGAGGMFSSGGDSGSLIVDGVTRRPVGLLFAGGRGTTFANPIDVVLAGLGVQIV